MCPRIWPPQCQPPSSSTLRRPRLVHSQIRQPHSTIYRRMLRLRKNRGRIWCAKSPFLQARSDSERLEPIWGWTFLATKALTFRFYKNLITWCRLNTQMTTRKIRKPFVYSSHLGGLSIHMRQPRKATSCGTRKGRVQQAHSPVWDAWRDGSNARCSNRRWTLTDNSRRQRSKP